MNWFQRLAVRRQLHNDLVEEMRAHLEEKADELVAGGLSRAEAARAARKAFGNPTSLEERSREIWRWPIVDSVLTDLALGIRLVRRSPGFATVAIATLALGIGANTAIWSVADAVLVRALPYRTPESLATISVDGAVSAPLFTVFRDRARSIQRAALYVNWNADLAGQGEPRRIPAARVSADLFDILGVQPILGRSFRPDEDVPGRDHEVLIGDGLWKSTFGADRGVIGRTIMLSGIPYSIIGVMPAGFQFPNGPELPIWAGPFPPAEMWKPFGLTPPESQCTGCFNWGMLARLRPGVTPHAAQAEIDSISKRLPGDMRRVVSRGVTVHGLQDAVTAQARTPILVLLVAVTTALLIACLNLASLLLARGVRRQHEIAVRLSLGASRVRVVAQMLTEAAVLAGLAAIVAVPLAAILVRACIAFAPPGVPRLAGATLDGRIAGIAFAMSLATLLLFAAGPAFLTPLMSLGTVLNRGGRTPGAAPARARQILIVAECALSLVLLAEAGLLGKSFLAVTRMPLGLHVENVLTLRTALPEARYDAPRRGTLVTQLVANCAAVPGVTSAAAVSSLPLTGESEGWGVIDERNPNPDDWTMVRVRAITPGYFQTVGIRLLAGRDFTGTDRDSNRVAIVSATAARKLWPAVAEPVGRVLKSTPPITIVGIVDDTRASGLDAEVEPYLYLPFTQYAPTEFALVVRSSEAPGPLTQSLKEEIWRLDKDVPVNHVARMTQLVADSIAPRRLEAVLVTAFGAFALILAAGGFYGVLSYWVALRTREMGVRMALGAKRSDVIRLVVGQGLSLALAGAGIGLVAGLLATRVLSSVLFSVSPHDPATFVVVTLILTVVAVVASYLPASRATRVDPLVALRSE